MGKYDGIHKPKKVKILPSDTVNSLTSPKSDRNKWLKSLVIQFIIASFFLVGIFGVSRANLPFSYQFTNGLRQAFTMDFSRGTSIVQRDDFLIDIFRNRENDDEG